MNNQNKTGHFITFEGGEGAGKSTLIKFLNNKLHETGISTLITREPGGSKGAEDIRDLFVQGDVDRWDFLSETFLLYAGRRDHIVKTIWPAIDEGKWVLCDRFNDSTLVYQGYARELPDYFSLDDFQSLARMSFGTFRPDLTFLIDIPSEVGLKRSLSRIAQEEKKENRFEMMDEKYHETVRKAYLELAEKEPDRFFIIDGLLSPEEIQEIAWEKLCEFFHLQGEKRANHSV